MPRPFFNVALLPVIAALAGASCSAGGSLSGRAVQKARKHDLVEVRKVIPSISIDLRYATADNVTKRRLYPVNMPCLLRRSTAAKLKKAQAILQAQGYGIRIWDAWRPPEVQIVLDDIGGHTGLFLSPDSGWSRHCGGISVDATMVDRDGVEVRMPTSFDEDLEHAKPDYTGDDPEVRRNLALFQKAMRQAGFTVLSTEWWHFDDTSYLHDAQPVVFGWELSIPLL